MSKGDPVSPLSDGSPKNDKELEKRAAMEPAAREELRKVVMVTALYQAQGVIEALKLDKSREKELASIGMTAFDKAFYHYMKYGHITENTDYTFSEYFGWWARQAIVSYIER